MSSKRFVRLMLAVVAAVALAGCVHSGTKGRGEEGKGGDPGGPIIVIRPEPEPTAVTKLAPAHQCKTEPCWYAGDVSSLHWGRLPNVANPIDEDPPEDPPKVPHCWLGLKSICTTENAPYGTTTCSDTITLTLDVRGTSPKIVITTGKNNNWAYPDETTKLGHVLGRDPADWPKLLLKKITMVTIPMPNGQPAKVLTGSDLQNLEIVLSKK